MTATDPPVQATFAATGARRGDRPIAARHRWLVVAFITFFLLLFAPKSPGSDCVQVIRFFGAAELALNCDSRLLAKLYRDAEKYFTEFNNWKERPVFFSYGVVAAPVMQPIAAPLWQVLRPSAQSDRSLSHFGTYFSLHLAHFVLNIGVVLFAIWMTLNLLGLDPASRLALALTAAIATSDLVHGGLWMAHTNIFNLLAVIACAFYFRIGFQHRLLTPGATFAWAGFAGLLVLVYPILMLALPAFVAGILFERLTGRGVAPDTRPAWPRLALAAILFVLPVVAWNVIVNIVFQTPVYMTAQYGQFVWLLEAWREERLWATLASQWTVFTGALALHLTWFEVALPLAGIAVVALAAGRHGHLRLADPVFAAIVVAILGILSFNYLQGYYAARMHIGVAVLLYMMLAHLGRLAGSDTVASVTLALVVAAQVADAALNFPASSD